MVQNGYKLYDLTHHFCFVSRDVTFHENVFPFLTNSLSQYSLDHAPVDDDVNIVEDSPLSFHLYLQCIC